MANPYWIEEAFESNPTKNSKGRVRRYLDRVYGDKAFRKDNDNIKFRYLDKAKRRIKRGEGRDYEGLLDALDFAKTLKNFAKYRYRQVA